MRILTTFVAVLLRMNESVARRSNENNGTGASRRCSRITRTLSASVMRLKSAEDDETSGIYEIANSRRCSDEAMPAPAVDAAVTMSCLIHRFHRPRVELRHGFNPSSIVD